MGCFNFTFQNKVLSNTIIVLSGAACSSAHSTRTFYINISEGCQFFLSVIADRGWRWRDAKTGLAVKGRKTIFFSVRVVCFKNNFFKPNTCTGKTCFNACTKTHPHPGPAPAPSEYHWRLQFFLFIPTQMYGLYVSKITFLEYSKNYTQK